MSKEVSFDPVLMSSVRLMIMAWLKKNKSAPFTQLQTELKIAPGNLSIQVRKLKEAGFLEVTKSFKENYPLTNCTINEKGLQALDEFQQTINELLA